jgi:hypothetical protein
MTPEKLIQALGYGIMAAAIELGGDHKTVVKQPQKRRKKVAASDRVLPTTPQTLWDQMPPVEAASLKVEIPPISDDVLARIDDELQAARAGEPPPGTYIPGMSETKPWT